MEMEYEQSEYILAREMVEALLENADMKYVIDETDMSQFEPMVVEDVEVSKYIEVDDEISGVETYHGFDSDVLRAYTYNDIKQWYILTGDIGLATGNGSLTFIGETNKDSWILQSCSIK